MILGVLDAVILVALQGQQMTPYAWRLGYRDGQRGQTLPPGAAAPGNSQREGPAMTWLRLLWCVCQVIRMVGRLIGWW